MKKFFTLLTAALILNSNITAENKLLKPDPPEWAKGIVWYQIFPERFDNGDNLNDPEPEKVFINRKNSPENWSVTPWTKSWFSQMEWEKKLGGNVRDHLYSRRYGGDIQGIINRLDYLKQLGIGGIYINPVFEAVSLHKYDGSTFHHIDVNFGPDPEGDRKLIQNEIPDDPSTWVWTSADKLFLKLIEEVHKRGMKIIIDGVFNHAGEQFFAFQDIILNGENSRFKDWFIIKSFDDPSTEINEFDYKGWWNIRSLPEFNRTENNLNDGPKEYIFNATKRWMDPNNDGDPSDGINGWRLDVARDVPLGFWKEWNAVVKNINPDALIIGELWELSPDFISENGVFDGLMNYNFSYAVKEFFIDKKKKIKTSEFINKLLEIDRIYPEQYLHVLQNLMSSHDTDRLANMIKNPDRDFDRDAHESNKNYDPSKPNEYDIQTQKLIAAFQMVYKGSPMIYYGDEIGMWGADDPHCRKPMVWNDLIYEDEIIDEKSGFKKGHGTYTVEQNKELLEFYKKLIEIRNNNIELQKGTSAFTYYDDKKDIFVLERRLGKSVVLSFFNLSDKEQNVKVPVDRGIIKINNLLEETEFGFEGTLFNTTISGKSFQIYSYKIPGMHE